MPVSKDAFKRYRVIDEKLSDPNYDYTTDDILRAVNHECEPVSIRMIQKDIRNIEEYFGKKMIRNAGGRGTVKYEKQSEPLFFKELTEDEENVLREGLKSLGQFGGLDNFMNLELLRKRLAIRDQTSCQMYISFSKNDGLQIPDTLLGRLFTAISRKKVIRITYTRFGNSPSTYAVYPYQLKQYNNRWYLICTRVVNQEHEYNPENILNLPLDRMDERFDYVEEETYIETPIDLKARFDEIVGVTYVPEPSETIVFAVSPSSLPYVETKWLHHTQVILDTDIQKKYREKYPKLAAYTFFSIKCKLNREFYALISSYLGDVIVVAPEIVKNELKRISNETFTKYSDL